MLKIIARLGDIPVGSTVTKLGGSKEYVVRDRLDIYAEDGTRNRIYANEGCLFLTDGEVGINAFGFDKELVWSTTLSMLNALQDALEEETAP